LKEQRLFSFADLDTDINLRAISIFLESFLNRDVEANYQVISQQSTRRSTIRGNFGKNMILASPQAQLSLVLQLLEPNLLRFTTIPSLQKVLTARIKLEFDFGNFSSIVQSTIPLCNNSQLCQQIKMKNSFY
jgi:hypothetical protein